MSEIEFQIYIFLILKNKGYNYNQNIKNVIFLIFGIGFKIKSYSLAKSQFCKVKPKSFGVSCNHLEVNLHAIEEKHLKLGLTCSYFMHRMQTNMWSPFFIKPPMR